VLRAIGILDALLHPYIFVVYLTMLSVAQNYMSNGGIFLKKDEVKRMWKKAVVAGAATCSRWFLARGFFYSEDGGDTFLRNIGSIHKIYTAPHPRRRHSSYFVPDRNKSTFRV
jgi:hypothetical protein